MSTITRAEMYPGAPRQLLEIRHGDSDYLASKRAKAGDANYLALQTALKADPLQPEETKRLAALVDTAFPRTTSDDDTPLAPGAVEQLKKYGEVLAERHERGELELPDVIFVSPTQRTRDTFAAYISGFPKLAEAIQRGEIQIIEDIRIREKLYGDVTLHSDRTTYFGAHPEAVEESRRLGRRASFEQRYPGGGQNIPDKMAQMRDWEDYISTEFAGQNVWAFTHHLSILSHRLVNEGFTGNEGDAVVDRFLDLDHHEVPPPGSVTEYEYQAVIDPTVGRRGRLVLKQANQVLA